MIWIGYHGTCKESIDGIKKDGYHKTPSKEGWLGEGVYFFQTFLPLFDGFREAKDWAINVKKFTDNWTVIEQEIHSKMIFDLVENDNHRKMFCKIRSEEEKKKIELGKKYSDNVIFDRISKRGVEVIRAMCSGNKSDRISGNRIITRPQIQINVVKTECIDCKNSKLHYL